MGTTRTGLTYFISFPRSVLLSRRSCQSLTTCSAASTLEEPETTTATCSPSICNDQIETATMEVRVSNFPEHLNDRPLRQFLWPHLLKLKIRAVDFKNAYGKKNAALTFLHEQEGAEFLKHHGQAPRVQGDSRRFPLDRQQYVVLKFNEKPVYFEKNTYPPDPHTIGVLEREQKQRDVVSTKFFNHPKTYKLSHSPSPSPRFPVVHGTIYQHI